MSLFGAVRLLLEARETPGPDGVGCGSLRPIQASAWAARRPEAAALEEIATLERARLVDDADPSDGLHVDTTAVSAVVRFASHHRLADISMHRSRPAA